MTRLPRRRGPGSRPLRRRGQRHRPGWIAGRKAQGQDQTSRLDWRRGAAEGSARGPPASWSGARADRRRRRQRVLADEHTRANTRQGAGPTERRGVEPDISRVAKGTDDPGKLPERHCSHSCWSQVRSLPLGLSVSQPAPATDSPPCATLKGAVLLSQGRPFHADIRLARCPDDALDEATAALQGFTSQVGGLALGAQVVKQHSLGRPPHVRRRPRVSRFSNRRFWARGRPVATIQGGGARRPGEAGQSSRMARDRCRWCR